MENKVCVYAICKNEEQFVDRWVDSMEEADSVVVLDTGSTDGTVEKLKARGVIVETKVIDPWRFDVARNESMKLIPEDCNILVCTDLDEVLEPGWAQVLRDKWIEGKHERAIYKYAWSHLEDGSPGRIFQYDKIHSRNWEWKCPVHELLFHKFRNLDNYHGNDYYPEEILYVFDEIYLHHYPDFKKSRGSYLSLLELRAKENPEDWYGLIYLAHEYYYRGYDQKAIDLLDRIITDYKEHYNSLEQASCYLFMGDGYKSLADKEENDESKKYDYRSQAKKCYSMAIKIEPTYIEPYLNFAKVCMDCDEWELSEIYIKKGLKNSFRHYTWLERDNSWSWEPWDLLCLATYYGGKKRDAIVYAAKALSFEPDSERLQNNLKLCLENTEDKDLIRN